LAWAELVRVQARALRWDDALRSLGAATAAGAAGETFRSLAERIPSARDAIERAAEPRARSLALADAWLSFGAPGLARDELLGLLARDPADADALVALVAAEAFDGRYDVARALLRDARRRLPALHVLWDATEQDLRRAERRFAAAVD
jgi:hypothetical protein